MLLYDNNRFSTYIPEDFIADSHASMNSISHHFYANYNDTRNEDVFIKFEFPKDKPELVIDGDVINSELNYEWIVEGYKYIGDVVTHKLLGVYNDQYFIVDISYPIEFSEGFEPRIEKIFKYLTIK